MNDNDFLNKPRENPEVKPLTNWAKEPTIQDLKQDLEAADPSHKTQSEKIREWNDLMYIKGKAKPKKVNGRSSIQPKLIRRQAEWKYSALTEPFLSSQKLFKIEPVTFEDAEAARQNELVLNDQFRNKINRIKFIDDYVRSTVDDGTCIIQTGWNRKTEVVTTMVPIYEYYEITDQESMDVLEQAVNLQMTNPRGYDETVPEEVKAAVTYFQENNIPVTAQPTGEFSEEKVEKFVENHPTAVIHHPDNVVIDPSCGGDIDKALFIVVSFETNKAELLKAGNRYKNLDKVDFGTLGPINDSEHTSSTPNDFQFKDKIRKKTVAYEYWGYYDINDDGVLVPIVATWIGSTIIRMEESPFSDGKLPFVLTPYLPVKRELYGEPDAALLEDQQNVSGAIMRGIIDLLGRSANSQKGIAKGLLDTVNKGRFDRGEDYEYNPTGNPQGQYIEHKYPEIPASAVNMLMIQNQEAESLTGTKAFAGGISGEAYGDVAAGIRGVLDAASKREMAILRRLANGLKEVGKKFIAMNAEFLSEKEVVRITNSKFVEINREDLKGNFDLIVDISTAEIDNAKSQDLAFIHQTLGPNMGEEISVNMILAEIVELKRMPELAEKLRTFKREPDPMQQEMAQIEMEYKRAEIAKMQAEAEKMMAEAKLASARADAQNLDYVEQETGTKHLRDLEKQKAQAKGNQDLAVTKALTQPIKAGQAPANIDAAIGFNELTKEDDSINGLLNSVLPQQTIPERNLNSQYFDPRLDPALNPALNNI